MDSRMVTAWVGCLAQRCMRFTSLCLCLALLCMCFASLCLCLASLCLALAHPLLDAIHLSDFVFFIRFLLR
jgi:hypothetical protein